MSEEMLRKIIREELVKVLGGRSLIRETATAKECLKLFGLRSDQLKKLWLAGQIRGRKLGDGKSAGMLYNLADIREDLNFRHDQNAVLRDFQRRH